MAVKVVNLSEPSIKQALLEPAITELRDPRFALRLRIHKARTSGSWFLVQYVNDKANWHKLGNWPALKAKRVIDELPALLLKLNPINSVNQVNSINQVNLNEWLKVADLLHWYHDRASRDRSLSDKRRANIKSTITKHLLPMLGENKLASLDHATIDEGLIWPLQERYALASVRQYFAILKRAFSQARKLKYLAADPLAGLSFTDFIDTKITAKGAKLQPGNLPELLLSIRAAKPFPRMLTYLMLALGTRIGETRQLTWSMIDFDNQSLVIPKTITKTNTQLVLPLTGHLIDVLVGHQFQQGLAGYRGKYLFTNLSNPGAINESTANDWVKSVSQGHWTAHDLRKLARTLWADLGIDYMVAEQLLNHAMTKLDQAYIHTYVEVQKRQALETYHQHLIKVKKQFENKTIPRSDNQSQLTNTLESSTLQPN